jgi:hypothetical protein
MIGEQVAGHAYQTSRKALSRKEHNVEDGPEVPLMRALRALKEIQARGIFGSWQYDRVAVAIDEIESWRPEEQ